MKILIHISRLLVGSLLIVSGLIKANDPIGFSYKLKEYFSADVLGLEWLGSLALTFAILICIIEIVLGVATITGSKMKLVSWGMLVMMVFFTFLTFYSAYYDKVTDCGCFGDALKISPWQSFSKDIILDLLILVIFINRKTIFQNNLSLDITYGIISLILVAAFSFYVISWGFPVIFALLTFFVIVFLKHYTRLRYRTDTVSLGISALFSILFTFHCLNHLPIKDFRPYAIGKNIPEQMIIPEGAPEDEYEVIYTLSSKVTNEVKRIDSKEYIADKLWEDKNWELLPDKTESKLIKEGYHPPIHDFSITSMEGEDLTDQILKNPGYSFILIALDLTKTDIGVQEEVNNFAIECANKEIAFFALTSSPYEIIDEFRHEVQAMYDYYTVDETTLKTIIRSNPGMLLLKNGMVINKWHYNDLPLFDEAIIDKS